MSLYDKQISGMHFNLSSGRGKAPPRARVAKSNLGRRASKRFLSLATLVSILFFIETAHSANIIDVEPISSFDLGTWSDEGDVFDSQIFCVASVNTGNGRIYPYWVKVTSLDVSGAFTLYRNGNSGSADNSKVTVNIYHRDVIDSTTYEQLYPDIFETHAHDGEIQNCLARGDNSELKIEIAAAELDSKIVGDYVGNFVLTGMGGVNGNQLDSSNFSVTINIDGAAQQVKVSGLNDVSFGTYDGSGDRQVNERFCVYSTTGAYRMLVSSVSQDSSGNFYLPSVSSGDNIPVTVSFIDSVGGPGTISVLNAPISGFGDSNSENCLGSENTTLTFSMNEQSLRSASSGDYMETFTVLVEPE